MSAPSRRHWKANVCGARYRNAGMRSAVHEPCEHESAEPVVEPPLTVGTPVPLGASRSTGKAGLNRVDSGVARSAPPLPSRLANVIGLTTLLGNRTVQAGG